MLRFGFDSARVKYQNSFLVDFEGLNKALELGNVQELKGKMLYQRNIPTFPYNFARTVKAGSHDENWIHVK